MKETYSDDALSNDLVKRWHREFKHGRKSEETAPRPGCPSSADDEESVCQVEDANLEDRRITIRQIAQKIKISSGSVETIIHNHLHGIRCLPDRFPGYSHLSRNKNASSARK